MSEPGETSEARSDLLLAQVRESYGRVAYTHKTHEKQADLCLQRHSRQQRMIIALTVLSSGTFLSALLGLFLSQSGAALVTSFIALLVTATNLGSRTFRYGEETQKHRDVAAKIWNLRESYQNLIVDIQSGALESTAARAERTRLQRLALEIYGDAPRTSSKAYRLAQSALKENEDLTFSTREIDLMLPAELRQTEERRNHEDQ